MTSENYRQLLNDERDNLEMNKEDFDNTLMHFAMLYHKEQCAINGVVKSLPNNGLANWSERNGWTYNFVDGKWWQLQESQNYIKLTTEELAKICLKETT